MCGLFRGWAYPLSYGHILDIAQYVYKTSLIDLKFNGCFSQAIICPVRPTVWRPVVARLPVSGIFVVYDRPEHHS